jgi:hypothetical protein
MSKQQIILDEGGSPGFSMSVLNSGNVYYGMIQEPEGLDRAEIVARNVSSI